MFGLPHAARLVESENADAAECTAGVPGMPFEPAIGGDGAKWGFGNGRGGDSRPEQPALPELHQLPPESAWLQCEPGLIQMRLLDRKSTRLNSSHLVISYAVFCLKKKKKAS